MGFSIVIVLLALATLLFLLAQKGWRKNETLQTVTNVAGIVALIATVAVFLVPQQTPNPGISKSPSPEHDSSDSVNFKNIRAKEPRPDSSGFQEENSTYLYLDEEQIRRAISRFLERDLVEKAVGLLRYLPSDKARDEECEHIFNYCLKNGKLEKAEEVLKFFHSPSKKEMAMRELALEKIKR